MPASRMIRAVMTAGFVLALAATPLLRAENAPPAAPASDASAASVPAPAAPAAVPAPATAAPAAATEKSAAASAVEAAPQAPKAGEFRFQFDGIPYADVIRRFSQMSGKPLLGDVRVEGNLTFFDSQPYTYDEAFDMLNLVLAMRGFSLVETARYLQVVPVRDVPKAPSKIIQGWAQAEGVRAGEIVTMVLPLKFITADDAVKVLTPVVSTYGSVAPLGRGRGVIITDRLDNIRRIRVLLDDLDQGTLSSDRLLKTYVLKHASARDLAAVINRLFGAGGPTSADAGTMTQRTLRNPQTGETKPNPDYDPEAARSAAREIVRATADERTNTLFLVGTGDRVAMADEVIRQLDAIQPSATGDLRIFEIKNARAEDVANTLRQALPSAGAAPGVRRGGAEAENPMQARVVADAATNRLIVTAPLDQMASIEELVRQLDQAGTNVGGLCVFRLQVADAGQLAGVVANAIQKGAARAPGARGGPVAGPQVSADARTNSLIVAGTSSDIQAAAALIEELDKPLEKEVREIHVVQLKAGDAKQIAVALTNLLRQQDTGRPGAPSAANIHVEAEPVTNSLLISAAPGDWTAIQGILDQLKASAIPLATPSTRLVPLQYAKAIELAETLRQIYANQSRGRAADRNLVPVVIGAGERSNCLLVSAADDDQKIIAELIKTMDVPSAEKVDPLHVIPMKAGDAVKVAETLRAMQPQGPNRGQTQGTFIQGDAASNSVLIRAPEAEFKALAEMVASLDHEITTSGGIKTFRLKVADAQQVAAVLQAALAKAGPRDRNTPTTTVSADSRTNSLIVAGPAADIQTAAALLAELDKPLDVKDVAREIHVFQLKAGDARQLAVALTNLLRQQDTGRPGAPSAANIRVEADSATNSLLISAAPGDWQTVQKVLAQLKASGGPLAGPVTRLIPLKYAKATELAATLRQVYANQGPNRPRSPNEPVTVPVVIAPSDQTNSLLVSAADDDQKDIGELVKAMDAPPAEGANIVQMRTYRLANAKAADLAAALGRLFAREQAAPGRAVAPTEPPARFEADAATNQVLVAATPSQFKIIEDLLAKLEAGTTLARETRTFRLKFAKAPDVVAVLQTMLVESPAPGSQGRRPEASGAEVRVAAMAETNDVVVQGPPERLALAEQLIATFDAQGASNQSVIQIVQLKNAQAASLADAVNAALIEKAPVAARRAAASGTEKAEGVSVTAEPNSNSVIVRGPGADVPAVVEMIRRLDEGSTAGGTQVRVYPLQNGDPTALAASLGKIFQAMQAQQAAAGGRQVRPAPFAISADERSKSLVVSTTPANFAIVEQVLRSLDQAAGTPEQDVQYVWLQNADATDVAAKLNDLYRDRKGGDRPVISADLFANALTVIAKDADLKTIEPIIAKLDNAAKDTSTHVRVIPLTQVRAEKMADVIRSVYSQLSGSDVTLTNEPPEMQPSEGGAGQAPVLDLPRKEPAAPPAKDTAAPAKDRSGSKDRPSVREGRSMLFQAPLTKPGVTIAIDKASNSLIVTGSRQDLDSIELLVSQLKGSAGGGEAEYRIFKITQSDAVSVARTLDALFNPKTVQIPVNPAAPLPPPPPPVITVVADARTRSVIVRAKPIDFELIEPLIKQLDQVPTVVNEVRIFALKNTDATEVAANLKDLFQPKQPLPGQPAAGPPAQGGSPQQQRATFIRQMIELQLRDSAIQAETSVPITISANRRTNAVVVAAAADLMGIVARLVEELDQSGAQAAPAVRIYPVKNADVGAMVAALQDLFAAGAPPTGRGPARGAAPSAEMGVTITGDSAGRLVIVSASADKHELVAKVIKEMDSAQGAGEVTVKVYHLKSADAATAAAALAASFEQAAPSGQGRGRGAMPASAGQVRISADRSSNCVVVRAGAADHERLAALLKELDVAPTDATGSYVVALKNGDATAVAQMVRDLYAQQAQAAARQRKSLDLLAVSSDARANAVVLATTKEMYEQVSQWVAQIETMQPARGTVRIITLQNADPAELDKAIRQIFQAPSAPGAGAGAPGRRAPGGAPGAVAAPATSGKVDTTVLAQQRAVLVSANDDDFETIKKLAETLDAAAADARRQVRVFPLKSAGNTRVASALNILYRPTAVRPGQAPSPEDIVTVTALPDSNAIVVSASKTKMEEVAHLVAELDKSEIAPQLEFRIFPLKSAQPTKIMPLLQQMLAQVRQTRPDEPVSVQADERTRSIIVTARGVMFDQVAKIIETLDKAPAYAAAEVLVVPLKRADATRLAAVLTDMLKPSATGQVTPEALALQEQVRLLRIHGTDAEKVPELDLTKPIKVSADPNQPGVQGSNSLLITSTAENLKSMKAVVEILDAVPLAEGVRVRFVHLANADATSVATVLREIFTQGLKLAGRPKSTVEGRAEPETASGKALVNPFNVSSDDRTNTLVMSGVEESLALADLVVKDLDREAGKVVTDVRLFRLKFADAAKMVPVLQAVFAEAATGAPGAEGLRTQVTRLRTVFAEQEGHTTELPKTRAALTIQADASTSIVIVAARSDVMLLVADVIQTMDIPGAGSMNAVRIFPLVNADATRLKGVLDGLYTGPNAQQVRNEDKPTVAVDVRTNALVISSSDKTFAMIATMLKTLDAKAPIETRDIRLVALKNADAATLATAMQKMMDARVQRLTTLGAADAEALRVIVTSDERSNSLMVAGSAEGFDLVKSLAEQLDAAGPALAGQVQLMPLKHANAAAISTSLTNLFNQRYQAARTPDVQRQKPVILADVRVNALLVAAGADDTKVIQGLLEKLDVELQNPSVQLVVIPLKNNDAGIVGPTIQQIFTARLTSMTPPGQSPLPQDRVDVSADALSNALIISASKENLTLIDGLLEKVDVAPPEVTGVVRIYPLQNSDAQRIATLLQGLVTQGLYKPGAALVRTNPSLAAREKVAIEADVRTNVLIVSASKENFAVIEEIIKKIDSSADFAVLGDIHLFTLKNADATRLAPTLQQLFAAKHAAEQAAGGGAGRSLPVSVFADPRTNTLLVTGSKESFNAVEAMVKELDTDQVLAANEFRIFYLKQGTAQVIQPTLQQLFAQRVARGGASTPVTIVSEIRTNALIVAASPEDMKLAESLINRLDAEPDRPGTSVQVFPLIKADATQVAATVNGLYRTQGQAAGAPAVVVSVDERTNALIVSAGPGDQKRIADLVHQLDTDTVPRVTEIRVFTLTNADAAELAQILTDALTNKPKPMTATSPNRQTLLQFVTRTKEGGDLVASALQEGVLITPDKRTNSLVVSAPQENMPLLESLITAMDAATPRMAEIRVVTLVNADARQMATVLLQLFRLQTTTGAAAAAAGRQAINYTLKSPDGTLDAGRSATIGSAEEQALSVTVDIRTNSLLIGGTKRYVDLAMKVVEELDSSAETERITEIYRLRNAQAADIQTALTNFLTQERTLLTQQLGAGSGASQYILDREVAVVAEPQTNTLLLSASPRYFEVVSQMIGELDQPPPQVLIQVLLAEVTLSDTNDFGIDWNFNDTFGSTTLKVGPSLGVQAALSGVPPVGFGVSATGGDINFFLRALESQNRLEVLSRPQILASDNQPATINIGQRVPFITNSTITENGTQLNTIQYQPIGIILNVTARINPDGFVKLKVAPEISDLSEATVTISSGVKAQIINNRTATTTVTVQDGHTIVIGGLITTKDQNLEDKVPFLGDLPFLGVLFKATHKVKGRTELLIILTPTVMRNISEADAETKSQVRRLNLMRETKHDAFQKSFLKGLDETHAEGPDAGQAPAAGKIPPPADPFKIIVKPQDLKKKAEEPSP